jgi:hypothetical protein
MDNVYSRGGKPKNDKYIDNWMTQEVKIHLVKLPSSNLFRGFNDLIAAINQFKFFYSSG